MEELDNYINQVKHLPPAPRILPLLLQILHEPDTDSSKVVELVSLDPGLTANVLQLCNSAYFASAMQVVDIHEAITRLGFQPVYQLVAAISGARALSPPQKGYGIDKSELWKHSVTSAVAAQLIARDKHEDENIVFTAALLHDIGKIVLSEALEHIYTKLNAEIEEKQASLLEAEKNLLGVQHAEIGGRLLARWKFPDSLVTAVWYHHDPMAAEPHQTIASYVYVGNMIAYFMGFGYGHHAFAFRGRAEALECIGLKSEQIAVYMMRTFEQMQFIEMMIRQGEMGA